MTAEQVVLSMSGVEFSCTEQLVSPGIRLYQMCRNTLQRPCAGKIQTGQMDKSAIGYIRNHHWTQEGRVRWRGQVWQKTCKP